MKLVDDGCCWMVSQVINLSRIFSASNFKPPRRKEGTVIWWGDFMSKAQKVLERLKLMVKGAFVTLYYINPSKTNHFLYCAVIDFCGFFAWHWTFSIFYLAWYPCTHKQKARNLIRHYFFYTTLPILYFSYKVLQMLHAQQFCGYMKQWDSLCLSLCNLLYFLSLERSLSLVNMSSTLPCV